MKFVVIVFFGLNCDCDVYDVIECVIGEKLVMVWYQESELFEGIEFVMILGGFFYGDYLCCGVMVLCLVILLVVVVYVVIGVLVLGVCNGFQIFIESGFLFGVLMCNVGFIFVCEKVLLKIDNGNMCFILCYGLIFELIILIVYYDGNYFVDVEIFDCIEGEGQVVFCYGNNLNGFQCDIVGVMNEQGNVLGMMFYLECVVDEKYGGMDGLVLFEFLLGSVQVR